MAMQMAVFTAVKSEHMKLRLKIYGNKNSTNLETYGNSNIQQCSNLKLLRSHYYKHLLITIVAP